MAEVAYQRGELEVALGHLTEGIALCRQLACTQPLATGLAVLAWIRQAEGDHAGALEAIGEAERVVAAPGVASLLNPVPPQLARLLLTQGDLAAATAWTKQRGLGAGDRPSYAREPEHLVLARVLLAHGRPEQAGELLERLQGLAVAQQRAGSRIEVHVLQALALAASGEEASAVTALAHAFTLAHPEGYVRLFADEGAPMAVLLGRLIATQRTQQTAADGIPLAYLGRVVRAVGQGLAPAGHPQRAARPCARHRAQTHHPPAGPGLPRLLTAARLILAGPPPGRQTRDGEAGQDQEGRGQPQAGDRGDHSVVSGELARYLAFQWQLAGHRA